MSDFLQALSGERLAFLSLITRLILGFLFFFQGYDAVFRIGIRKVADTYQEPYSARRIHPSFIFTGALFTSYAELLGGFLLILGLFKYPAFYLLGLDLAIASLAFGIAQPMWDMRHVFPRLVLLVFLLMLPAEWDTLSLDHLIQKP